MTSCCGKAHLTCSFFGCLRVATRVPPQLQSFDRSFAEALQLILFLASQKAAARFLCVLPSACAACLFVWRGFACLPLPPFALQFACATAAAPVGCAKVTLVRLS